MALWVHKKRKLNSVAQVDERTIPTERQPLVDEVSAKLSYVSEFLATDPEVQVRFPALPDFLRSSWSGTEYTQPHENN
jgi:hypothetical protein